MKRFSLRARITAVGILTLALVVGLGALVTVRVVGNEVDRDVEQRNAALLESMAADVAAGADPANLVLPLGADYSNITILDADGVVLNATYPDEVGDRIDDPLARQASLDAARGGTGLVLEAVTPQGDVLTLLSQAPVGLVGESLQTYRWFVFVLIPFLIAAGGLILWIALGSALRPVQRMTDEANGIDAATSGDRLQVPASGDEITHLALTLNRMLDRLDAGLERQRQFVSDASHELRSPLTAITGASELLEASDGVAPDHRPIVATLRRGAQRLEVVLDDLTRLADVGTTSDRVDVDLDEVIMDEVAAVGLDHPTVRFDTTGVVPSVVAAHEVQLGRAAQNLLSNAARHAERCVTVSASADDVLVTIVVEDDGPGVPVEDRERVFDRFVRLDDHRRETAADRASVSHSSPPSQMLTEETSAATRAPSAVPASCSGSPRRREPSKSKPSKFHVEAL